WIALGISASVLVHTLYLSLGLGILIEQHHGALAVITLLGGGYLIYLGAAGLYGLFRRKEEHAAGASPARSGRNDFMQGLLCNLLNPKTITFFLVFFGSVLGAESSTLTRLLYGTVFAAMHLAWFAFVNYAFTSRRARELFQRRAWVLQACC